MSYQQQDPYAGYDQDQVMHDNEMLDLGNDEFNDDNDGWGVDSDVYTTKLNTGQLTKEQIAMAIQLEREIMDESSGGAQFNSSQYEYTEDEYGGGGGGSAYSAPALIQSPEEAMRLLAQRKGGQQASQARRPQQQQQQRAPARPAATHQRVQQQAPRRAYGTAKDEVRAYHELCKQFRGVQAKLSGIGEPTPAQKKKFLQNLTRGLIACLRYPVPVVRSAISAMFLNIGWDVRRNRSPPNVRQPPSGAMLKELLAKTVDFFGARHNLPKRSKYILPPRQNAVRPRQPQQQRGRGQNNRNYNNNGNNNYNNNHDNRRAQNYNYNNGGRGGYGNRGNAGGNGGAGGGGNNSNLNNNRNYRGNGQNQANRNVQHNNQQRDRNGNQNSRQQGGRGGGRSGQHNNNNNRQRSYGSH